MHVISQMYMEVVQKRSTKTTLKAGDTLKKLAQRLVFLPLFFYNECFMNSLSALLWESNAGIFFILIVLSIQECVKSMLNGTLIWDGL